MKTAVEWLADFFESGVTSSEEWTRAKKQAKEMEKQQIIDAINFGDERGKITTYSTAEQYYNETFKT
jgi:hypothetical protein